MSLVGEPCVGIVYCTKNGITYTDWWHEKKSPYILDVKNWIRSTKEMYSNLTDVVRIMAIIRVK